MSTIHATLYDPAKTFKDNFEHGPFPLLKNEAAYKNKGKPTFHFLGNAIYSPFGIPAGPLLNSRHIRFAFNQGFDVICYKTQRSTDFPCNEFPNVLYVDVAGDLTLEKAAKPLLGSKTTKKPANKLSITNSFGNPSRGPSFWVADLKKALSFQGKG